MTLTLRAAITDGDTVFDVLGADDLQPGEWKTIDSEAMTIRTAKVATLAYGESPRYRVSVYRGSAGTRPVAHDAGATLAAYSAGGAGLPSQWTDGGHGDVTVTTDDGSVPITIAATADATGTTAFAGANNDLTFTSVVPGADGNHIEVDFYNDGPSQSLTVIITGVSTVEVHLATNGGGASTSTAATVKTAIEATSDASRLVTVTYPVGNDGSGVIPTASFDFVVLAGGSGDEALTVDGNTVIRQADHSAGPGLRVVGGLPTGGPFDLLSVETADGSEALKVTETAAGQLVLDLDGIAVQMKSPSGVQIAAGTSPMSADILSMDDFNDVSLSGFDKVGRFWTNVLTAPADGDIDPAHRLFLWFDDTNGASKLMIKGKSADGTVVTGSVNLT